MIKLEGMDFGARKELPEDLRGVREIICNPRKDKTTAGMHAVDGYYHLSDNEATIRQIRVYDVKTAEEAVKKAKEEGLVQGIMVECYLSEPQPCMLGRNNSG
jgi:hypothetical protein